MDSRKQLFSTVPWKSDSSDCTSPRLDQTEYKLNSGDKKRRRIFTNVLKKLNLQSTVFSNVDYTAPSHVLRDKRMNETKSWKLCNRVSVVSIISLHFPETVS